MILNTILKDFSGAISDSGSQSFIDVTIIAIKSILSDISDLSVTEVNLLKKENQKGNTNQIIGSRNLIEGSVYILSYRVTGSFTSENAIISRINKATLETEDISFANILIAKGFPGFTFTNVWFFERLALSVKDETITSDESSKLSFASSIGIAIGVITSLVLMTYFCFCRKKKVYIVKRAAKGPEIVFELQSPPREIMGRMFSIPGILDVLS